MRTARPTILVATTNDGKLKEILLKLEHQDFDFISLKDLPEEIEEPVEDGGSMVANAMLKATYYGKKTGHITIADDTGLFLHGLDGWPGIHVGRFLREEDGGTFTKFLQKLDGVADRSASFRCSIVVYDPDRDNTFVSGGALHGEILHEPTDAGENHWGYNRLFHIPDAGKSYGQMTIAEKSEISHRSKALHHIKYFLSNTYGSKQIVIPVALIIRDGKLLMHKRNDPFNLDVHEKWEFPGGSIDFGENPRETVVREAKEESGYEVDVVKMLQHIHSQEWDRQDGKIHYQLHVIPYVCKIVGGESAIDPREVIEAQWFEIDDVLHHDLMGPNKAIFQKILLELKALIAEHNL